MLDYTNMIQNIWEQITFIPWKQSEQDYLVNLNNNPPTPAKSRVDLFASQ